MNIQATCDRAAVKALRDDLENEVAALVLKILVEYQVADIAGDPIKIDFSLSALPDEMRRYCEGICLQGVAIGEAISMRCTKSMTV